MAKYIFIQPISSSYAHLQPDNDPVTAKTPFFAHENAAKWAVPQQWYTYWMERHHSGLTHDAVHAAAVSSQATGSNGSESPNHDANG